MDCIRLLNVKVHRLRMSEAVSAIERFIGEPRAHHVVTADASMIVLAHRDPELARVIEEADLVTADGFGLIWASGLLGRPIRHKVSGVDLVAELCQASVKKGHRLYFLGAAPGVAQAAAARLQKRYPGVNIVGTRHGFFTHSEEASVVDEISSASPDVVLVAFGIPKQEQFIARNREKLGVRVLIGVGGSFDVYSGKVQRAPVWVQRSGWEWLFRLSQNPRKIGKVMTLPRFVLLAIRARLTGAS